jgi:hypothetical protein
MGQRLLFRRDVVNRMAVSVIFIYFGFLKIIQLSPAEELVTRLQAITLPFVSSYVFIVLLGTIEVVIGSLFLLRRITGVAVAVFAFHILT